MQLLGLQGFWQHQVLRGVGGWDNRKYSVLEGYGNQYWPVGSSILAWRTLLPDREAWQAIVHRVAKNWTLPKRPCTHRRKAFFGCGSSAPVRVGCEGDTAAWLAGTLVAPSVQGHGQPPPQELWPYRVFSRVSCSWRSEGLLGQLSPSFHLFRHLECSLAWGPSLLFDVSGT